MRGKGLEARLVSSEDKAFRALMKELEGECTRRFGKGAGRMCMADPDAETISTCVILKNGQGIACGLLQDLDGETAQVRCLYVKPEFRKLGLGVDVIQTLELQGLWQGCMFVAAAVSREMKECFGLCKKLGFQKTAPWAGFSGDKNWTCLKKEIE